MGIASWIAIYILIWWVVLFAVLPWGVRSHAELGSVTPGTEPGAPAVPRLLVKFLVTTAIASVLFGVFVLTWKSDLAGLRPPVTVDGTGPR